MQSPGSSPKRQTHLDGVRGVAIVLVLIEHFAGLHTGRLGVDTFFVLSGLLMARVLFEDKLPLRTFYRNRVARIFPVFYLYLAVTALCAWIWLPTVDWPSLGSAAVYLRSYWPHAHIWTGALPVGNLWSLNVEEHAYVLLSLAALGALFRGERTARWMLTLLCLACLGFYAWYRVFPLADDVTSAELRTECAALPLLLSAALFLWGRVYRLEFSRRVTAAVLAGTLVCSIVVVAQVLPVAGRLVEFIVLPCLLALSINLLQGAPVTLLRALSMRWLTWLGLCSFSIYIWHYPFFYLDALNTQATWFRLAAALVLSALSYYLYEQPMRRWIRRL